MSNWKRDFPVAADEDSYVTRREFTKFLGLTSVAFMAGTIAAVVRKWVRGRWPGGGSGVRVAAIKDVAVGECKLFNYPTANDPCILVRVREDKFVAFNQRCTHLSCPVYFRAESNQLVCPCHHGFFNAEDGRPIAGPAKRQLETVAVEVDGESVWVKA